MDNSPFGRLPAELRVEIFEFALSSSNDTNVLIYDDEGPSFAPWVTANHRRALTMVCSQIRAESFPIFYRFNKLCFFPLVLDKFVPGFFHTDTGAKERALWEYLGNWLGPLSEFLDHLGEECMKQVEQVQVCIGTWNIHWASHRNSLMVWLTRGLAGILKLFRNSNAVVSLHFDFEYPQFAMDRRVRDVSLPISDIEAAYHVLEDVIAEEKEVTADQYLSLTKARRKHLDQCFVGLYQYLGFLEMAVGEDVGIVTKL